MNQSSNFLSSTDWSELQRILPTLQEASTDSSVPNRYQDALKAGYRICSQISQSMQQQGGSQSRVASAGSGQQGENSNIGQQQSGQQDRTGD